MIIQLAYWTTLLAGAIIGALLALVIVAIVAVMGRLK